MKLIFTLLMTFSCFSWADKLKVCSTVTDLADLVKIIGGDEVEVTTFAPARGNPHFVTAKPQFIRSLSRADVYIQNGLDLELGWAPVLVKNCRNAKVLPGKPGHIDASKCIIPLYDANSQAGRGEGHVHPNGNPHYLMDPVNGLLCAQYITDSLCKIAPAKAEVFKGNLKKFQKKLLTLIIGKDLIEKYEPVKLVGLLKKRNLVKFLELTKQQKMLKGLFGKIATLKGKDVAADHAGYLYLVTRLGINITAYLEPKPGMSPTTSHLLKLVKKLPQQNTKAIITNSYFPAKYAQTVSKKTSIPIIKLAHQVNSVDGCDSYCKMVEYNINKFIAMNE